MIEKNSIHTVTVTGINNLGYGIARIDGIVVFIKEGVTNDELEIKIIKSVKDYSVGRIERIIKPSPYRIDSPCPVSKRCGGCVFQHISYDYELKVKQSIVKSAFKKCGLDNISVGTVISNGQISGYRNKVMYPVGPSGEMGFYAEKSHDIIEHDICLLQKRSFDKITKMLKRYLKKHPQKGLRHVYIRGSTLTADHMLCFVVDNKGYEFPVDLLRKLYTGNPEITSVVLNYNTEDTNVILGNESKVVYFNDYINDAIGNLNLRVSSRSFYQVNNYVAELLYKAVLQLAAPKEGDYIVDLYCGTGSIGLYVMKNSPASKLIGIEINDSSVKNALFNADLNGISNAKFICSDATDAAVDGADIIIIDPPRKGCERSLIERIATTAAKKVVYVSCDPATLARDVKIFHELGFSAGTVYPVDMFPRTGHVECVVLLSREKVDDYIKISVNTKTL